MSNDARLLLVYTLRAAALAAAVYVLEIGFPLELVPLYLQYEIVQYGIAIAAVAVVATAFGVGAMRWPITPLLGAGAASFVLSGISHPGILLYLIWLSWIMGALAKVIMLNSDLLCGIRASDAEQGPHGRDAEFGGVSMSEPA